jgi:Ca2+ transporting ATPase
MEDAYARSVTEVLDFFRVEPRKGLSEDQVVQHGRIYGKNVLPEEKRTPFWKLVLKQFDDLLVKILIAAALVSFLLALFNGETGLTAFLEPSVILMILAANAAVGVITETNAEKALEELRAYQADIATVLRNGCFSILPATELVPGDIVEVCVGCKIPADMRMIEMLSNQLRVDQAILTGESCSVEKELESTRATIAVYQDKTNILFSGTVVVAGRARAVVVGVGANTAMGSIRDSMLQTEDEVTPLKKKLDEFGTFLAKVIAGICVLVWIVNIGHFRDPAHGGFLRGAIHYFKIAVALAVAAIPEGLPAVVTTCLALGTKRMARLNAIVRSLPSVETLGCTTVICSDKTGTLTTNMMSVSKVCVVHSVEHGSVISEYSVSGTTYAPEGIIFDGTGMQLEFPAQLPCLLHIAMCSALCNESVLQYNPDKGNYEKIGESTEVALRVLAEKVRSYILLY